AAAADIETSRPRSKGVFRDPLRFFDADPERAGRQRCPYAAMFRAERTVAGAGRNFGRIRQPVQLEGNVAAVAAAADQHEFRSLRCPNSLMDSQPALPQSFLAAPRPGSRESGTVGFKRAPTAPAARGAATSARGTKSEARNTEAGLRPVSTPLALATNPATAAPRAIPAC